MQHSPILEKTLLQVYSSQTYQEVEKACLEGFSEGLALDELELLGLLVAMKGEERLEKEPQMSQLFFDLAEKIAPGNSKILCRLALAYLSLSSASDNIAKVCQVVEKLLSLDPLCFEGWFIWANALMTEGIQKQNSVLLFQAEEKFQKADRCRMEKDASGKLFFWRWGLCWHSIAKDSGEASDFKTAIEKYKLAIQENIDTFLFWNDYGNALIDLGCLVSLKELFIEASDCYAKAIQQAPDFFEAWFNLGCSYQRLYEWIETKETFDLAQACFERASLLQSEDPTLWYRWGELLLSRGKSERRVEDLQLALEKYRKAQDSLPMHPLVLRDLAEVLMLLGAKESNLQNLEDAENYVLRAIEQQPEKTSHWVVYGLCLLEKGHYFNNQKTYEEAIEKFQHGLALDRLNPHLWYGLALAHMSLGILKQEIQYFEKASRFFSRCLETGGDLPFSFWNDWGVALMYAGEIRQSASLLEKAIAKFEYLFNKYREKHGGFSTVSPKWLYHYGCAWDVLGNIMDDETLYEKAIQILSQVLSLDPHFPNAHYRLALAFGHWAEVTGEIEGFYRAMDHLHAVIANDPEDDMAWNDWGLACLHLAQLLHDPARPDVEQRLFQQAETKFMHAISLGNIEAFYNLACLHSLQHHYEAAFHYIQKAETFGSLPSVDELMQDDWLEGLRSTADFPLFLREISTTEEN